MKRFLMTMMSAVLLLATGAMAEAAPRVSSVAGKLTPDDQLSSKFRINDEDPESSVPSLKEKNDNPIEFGYFLQDLLVQSEAALNAKDYPALVRYRRALVKAAPERAAGWSKLCEAYDLLNDRDHAVRTCRQAIQRDGAAVGDFLRLVKLTLQKSEPLLPTELSEMRDVLAHLDAQGPNDPDLTTQVSDLRCQLAVKTNDTPLLESCTAVLAAKAPNDTKTVIYQWSLAVRQGKKKDARVFFDKAKQLGVPSANLERMEKFTQGGLAGLTGSKAWIVGGVLALGLMGLAVMRVSQRRRVTAHG